MVLKTRDKVMAWVVTVTLAMGLCPGFAMAAQDDSLVADSGAALIAQAGATAFEYTGDTVTAINAEGGEFGMFTPQDGTKATVSGDKVVIDYYPKNKTVYGSLYLNADINEESTWLDANKVEFDADGNFKVELDKANCGKALPIVPVKKSDGKTTSSQYYLAIPALDKISGGAGSEGTELAITNNLGMFKVLTASVQKNDDGSATLVMALNGTGYHFLYKGTYEAAVANGENVDNWIKGYENADGKWEFKIPVAANEIGVDVPLVAISQSYYDKFIAGENPIERAFYPRQFNLDIEKATLTTDDYSADQVITVTKETGLMMSLMGTSTLTTVGGPNSNGYAATLTLAMDSSSFDKAFVGTAEEAAKAAEDEIAKFNTENKTFDLKVMWMETAGKPETVTSYIDGTPFIASFYSVKNKQWYERALVLDAEAGTLKVYSIDSFNAAQKVDELIAAIQVQKRTATTDADCKAAKDAWDALTDEQEELVQEADYFGLDTGDASKDDPLNADKIGPNEILITSFGTSFNDSRVATIGGVEKAVQAAYPDWSVRRAFTAQIIINHIQARDGEVIDNMEQALERAVANGVKQLVVAPTHLMHGAEYDELVAALEPYKTKIEKIVISEPLLGPKSTDPSVINADKEAVAKAAVAAAVADAKFASQEAAEAAGTAFVFMGHGTSHEANVTYTQMQAQMDKLGYKNVFIGTVEGEPADTECSVVIDKVKAAGYKNVILRPLMVVAGDHANNDMADPDDPESWYSQFKASGNFDKIDCQIAGLGQIAAVQQVYVDHIAQVIPDAIKSIAVPTAKADLIYTGAAQTGVAAGTGYTLSGTTQATDAGTYKATAKIAAGNVWADGTTADKTISWTIAPADIAKAKVTLKKASATYNGKSQKGAVKTVVLDKATLKANADYTVSAKAGKNAGSYAVTVTGKGNYTGTAKATYKVKKAKATAKLGKTKTFKTAKLKKKAQSYTPVKLTTDGKATWKVVKNTAGKKIKVNTKTGKVTMTKKVAKGTYTLKLKVSAKAGKNYSALKAKTYTVTVKVK